MNDDELMGKLGERARQRWSASSPSSADSDDVPLSADDEQALIDGVLDRLDAPSPDKTVVPLVPPANHRRRSMVIAASVVMALAAGLVLWLSASPVVAPLPAYEDAGFEGGTAIMRGDDTPTPEVPVLDPTGELRWRMRPATAIKGSVGMRVLAQGERAHCLDIGAAARVSADGAIEIQGRVGTILPLPAGTFTLTAIVGRADVLETMDDPCAWRTAGEAVPEGFVVAAERTIRIAGP